MFVDVVDGKLFALRHGDRSMPTVVGIGGFVGSSELWAEPLAQLSGRWSTIAYDHRGTGASIAATSSITFDNLVDDLFVVMDAFGVERGVIAAESSGALTALTAALARPDRVSHLVIVDGSYDAVASSDATLSDWQQYLLNSYEAWVTQFVIDCIPEADAEHVRAWGNKILSRVAPEDAVALSKTAPSVGIRTRLGEIDQPTLVIHGRLDAMVPVEHAEHLAASIPVSELRIIEDAGHVPSLTRPTQVADAIAEFLVAH
jgi:3-oxoadipate enol-lactonase